MNFTKLTKLYKEDILKLIELYKKNECLWDFNNPYYKKSNLKEYTWKTIAMQFNMSVDDVKKKIKHLRSNYVAEKKKCDKSDEYISNLFYYGAMSFLDEVIVLRKNNSDIDIEVRTFMYLQPVRKIFSKCEKLCFCF